MQVLPIRTASQITLNPEVTGSNPAFTNQTFSSVSPRLTQHDETASSFLSLSFWSSREAFRNA